MALGIACAGTGNKDALALIEPMKNDPVNYVRQGALIASAMILVQQTEQTCPKVKDFRALYAKVITDNEVLEAFRSSPAAIWDAARLKLPKLVETAEMIADTQGTAATWTLVALLCMVGVCAPRSRLQLAPSIEVLCIHTYFSSKEGVCTKSGGAI